MPDTCVPTSTFVMGSMVQVAVTVVLMEPFFIVVVSYVTVLFSPERKIKKRPAITAKTMMMIAIFFILFRFYVIIQSVDFGRNSVI